eukprot:1143245-Pelagomonas_calceolata.AAC.8
MPSVCPLACGGQHSMRAGLWHEEVATLFGHRQPYTMCRYIVTARGLAAMLEKFKSCDFNRCPRVLCEGQACLPVGTSDIPGQSTVKMSALRAEGPQCAGDCRSAPALACLFFCMSVLRSLLSPVAVELGVWG